MRSEKYDVLVVGAGSAGVAAAVASARNGARTLLIDSGPSIGGELLSGMTIDGAINARGERIIGGVIDDIVNECRALGGYARELNDWRLIRYIACDPEYMKMAVARVVYGSGAEVRLNTFADDVARNGDRIEGVVVRDKQGRSLITANIYIDCSGDADLCALAGSEMLPPDKDTKPQPVSMMFRMAGVETQPLLEFVRQHPEYFAVGESDAIRGGRSDREIAEEIYKQGEPCVFLKGDADFLGSAIARGEMFPTALIMIQPTSAARREVCVNATRITLDNPLVSRDYGRAFGVLIDQVQQCSSYLSRRLPGFENAALSGVAPRIGVRETRRILGDEVLDGDDVFNGRKREDGIAKGCHHIDIHQDGTGQIRIPVADGGSYDIPFATLIPVGLSNVMVAGRCFSADRRAQGSARVMGGCLAMGQAVGTAASMLSSSNAPADVRAVPVQHLRTRLKEQGAILDGTH